MRPAWDEYFMQIARTVATRATCPRASVGCVLTRDRRILTTGYNGAPRGVAHCTHQPCINCSKLFISAGIDRIVYEHAYPDPIAAELLAEAGVAIVAFASLETAGRPA